MQAHQLKEVGLAELAVQAEEGVVANSVAEDPAWFSLGSQPELLPDVVVVFRAVSIDVLPDDALHMVKRLLYLGFHLEPSVYVSLRIEEKARPFQPLLVAFFLMVQEAELGQ